MEYQWKAARSCPDAGVITSDFTILHNENNFKFDIKKPRRRISSKVKKTIDKNCSYFQSIDADLLDHFGFLPSACLIHQSVFSKIGFFDETIAYQEDLEFFMRAAVHFPFAVVHKRLTYYRRHDENMTINTREMENSLKILTERMLRFPDNYAAGAGQFYLARLKRLFVEKHSLIARRKRKLAGS